MGMSELRWGIWCIELCAWCTGADHRPETFASQQTADEAASDWQQENERHVAAKHVNPFDGWKRIEPLRYEARRFEERPQASASLAASGA